MPTITASPMKGSPRRRKTTTGRKSVSFTPKKVQVKVNKRSVRWKDDEQDGSLAEWQKSPQKSAESADEASSEAEPLLPRGASPIPRNIPVRAGSPAASASPAPVGAEQTLSIPKNGSRFKAGFLSKKTSSSPLVPPPSTSLTMSDSESSPLREIEGSSFLNRPSRIAVRTPSGNYSSSPVSDSKEQWKSDKEDAIKINSAMRRISSGQYPSSSANTNSLRVHRRRSPSSNSTTPSGSSPSENTMFTASQARRMVKSEKEFEAKPRVLSPRTLPIMKNTGGGQRRTTLGGEIRSRDVSLTSRDAIRLSVMPTPGVDRSPEVGGGGLR
jgi:kinesin family protein 18/19